MKLIAYNSSESGGMLGSYASTKIFYTSDGRCRVDTASKVLHSDPITHVTYYADGLLEKLSEVCERYNVIGWTDLPENNIFMHDSSSKKDNFSFEDGTIIVLGSSKKYPEHAGEMYGELKQLINDSENYAVDLEVTEESSIFTMGMMGKMPNMTPNMVNVIKPANQNDESIKWAQYCVDCGAKFNGSQRFCAECGSVRKSL